jgi:hypothetical protein
MGGVVMGVGLGNRFLRGDVVVGRGFIPAHYTADQRGLAGGGLTGDRLAGLMDALEIGVGGCQHPIGGGDDERHQEQRGEFDQEVGGGEWFQGGIGDGGLRGIRGRGYQGPGESVPKMAGPISPAVFNVEAAGDRAQGKRLLAGDSGAAAPGGRGAVPNGGGNVNLAAMRRGVPAAGFRGIIRVVEVVFTGEIAVVNGGGSNGGGDGKKAGEATAEGTEERSG